MMSFFIVLDLTHEMTNLLPICAGFRGTWPSKCGRPLFTPPQGCFITNVWRNFASKTHHGWLQ